MEKNKTAVEWLTERILSHKSPTNLNGTDYVIIPLDKLDYLQWKAKEMEKEQIVNAHNEGKNILPPNENGEQYYNETYGK